MTEPTSTPLSASDRLLWRIERDPVLRSSITTVGELDREPDDDALRQTLTRASQVVERLHQRISVAGFGRGRPVWVEVDDFDVDQHVRRVRAAGKADLRSVLDLAALDVAAAFDPARPPWTCTIVDGLPGDRAAFVLRYHHSIADGVGSIDLAGAIFDRDRSGAPPPTRTPEPLDAAPGALERVTAAVGSGLGALLDPIGMAGSAVATVRSMGRLLTPAPRARSPLLVGRGINRWLAVTERPLVELTATAARLDATVNDVFLAVVSGALASYHDQLGSPVPALRFTMPINVRADDDPAGGNHFTPVRYTMRIDEPELEARVRRANETVRRWRHEPAVGLTPVLATVLDQLPTPVVTAAMGSMFKGCDVDAVDVPGLRRPAYVGGAAIERLWGFGPPTGAAVSVTLVSHLDVACIGLLADTAAVQDPPLLAAALELALDEIGPESAPT